MMLRRHPRRHHTLSYAVLSFLAFGIAVPIVIGSRMDRLDFSGVAALAAMRDSYTLGAPLPLVPVAGIVLERGTVSIAKSQAAVARSGEALLALLASGNARLVLNSANVVFTSAAEAADVSPPIDAAAPLIATLLGSRFESLRINQGVVTIPHVGQGVTLVDVNADISMRRKGVISARGSLVLNGRKLEFDAGIGVGDRRLVHRLPLKATLKGDLVRVDVDGRLTLGSGLQLSASSPRFETPSLRELATWLGYRWPLQAGFERFRAEGNLDLADTGLSLQQASLQLDGNEATGGLFLQFGRDGVGIDATLATRRLDLAPYLSGPAVVDAVAAWQTLLPHLGLGGLPILSRMQADLRLSAERVTAGSVVLGRGAATLTARDGRVTADIADFEAEGGGSGGVQVTLDNGALDTGGDTPSFTLSGRVRRAGLGGFLPLPVSGIPVLAGAGDASIDVSATGRTADELLSTLSGTAALALPKGGQIGLDLSVLMAVAQAKAAVGGWQAAGGRGATMLDDLGVRFRIHNGRWTVDSARARAGNAVYLASGSLYPPAKLVDLSVVRANGIAGQLPSADGAMVPGVATQSVLVRGPWAVPQILPGGRADKAAEPLQLPMPAGGPPGPDGATASPPPPGKG